jgi:hypothetical protein
MFAYNLSSFNSSDKTTIEYKQNKSGQWIMARKLVTVFIYYRQISESEDVYLNSE